MKRLLGLVILLPAPLWAQQNYETSYDYFDANYLGVNWSVPSATDLDGNGITGRVSIQVRDHLFLTGLYSAWDFDGVDGSSMQKDFGIGSNWTFRRFSIYGAAGIRSLDLDVGTGNMKKHSGYATAGARLQLGRAFEVRASADYADMSPVRTGETSVTVGGDIYLTEVIALSLEASQHEDDTTSYLVGFRFYHRKDSSNMRKRR